MKLKMFSIKDTVVGAHASPFVHNNNETAKRAIKAMLAAPGSNQVKDNYQDKQLYSLGWFDDEKGELVEIKTEFICNLTELAEKVEG